MWRLREDVEAKINRLPLSYFDRVQRGELISRCHERHRQHHADDAAVPVECADVGAHRGGRAHHDVHISWQLALVALVSLPLMAVIFGVIGPKSQKAFGEQWKKVGRLKRPRRGVVLGPRAGQGLRPRKGCPREVRAENEELYQASFAAQFLSGMIMPGMMFVGNLTYVGIAVLGGLMVAGGQIRLGDVQAFIQYSQQFTQPLSQLGGMAAVVHRAPPRPSACSPCSTPTSRSRTRADARRTSTAGE